MLHFHLRSVSNTNFTSDFFFSLTHGLIVFSFQLFERSSRFLSVTESSFNPTVITDHTFYKLNQFTFIETCLMAQKMDYLGNNSMCAWKKKKTYIQLFWGRVFYKYQRSQAGWLYCSNPLCPYWFCLLVLSLTEWGVLNTNCNCGFVYFSLQFYQFLPHVFWIC